MSRKEKKNENTAAPKQYHSEKETRKALTVTLVCAAAVIVLLCVTVFGFRYSIQDDGTWAISGYSGGSEIKVPDKYMGLAVTRIKPYAFFRSDDIVSAELGGNVRELGVSAFFACSRLERVIIKPGTQRIENFCFAECPRLSEVFIPESVNEIGDSVFSGSNPALVIVTPPDSYAAEYAAAHAIEWHAPDAE